MCYPNKAFINAWSLVTTLNRRASLSLATLATHPDPIHPKVNTERFTLERNTAISFDPLINDYDANGESVSLQNFDSTSTQGGQITQAGNELTYTPVPNFEGLDSFNYTISDGTLTNETSVFIDVVSTTQPALYLPFEENSGTTVYDASGHGHTGKLVNFDISNIR